MPLELEFNPTLTHGSCAASARRERARPATWKWRRRYLVGPARRLLRWEFWPAWAVYPPVVVYLLYLGLKHRSCTLFTAANPAIEDGGFVGESKYGILQSLRGAGECLPKTLLLKTGDPRDRLAAAEHFMRSEGLDFPIVLKPDAGQRGTGVAIIRSNGQLREYLFNSPVPVIVQEYIAGVEFGVFYCRIPGQARGRIFSVTEKQMPSVVGDGQHTLEELILADHRAVCMADAYLRKNADRAHDVPRAGERVQLVEIGTHCRGAIFLDGRHAITPALEAAIDRIAQSFDGFYFGRFDLRVPSLEDFRAGRNIKVIELNGVTSEATHIYDPQVSLLEAYQALFRQWRIAFEIGDLNRRRGVRPSGLSRLLGAVRAYRRLSLAHAL